MMSTDCPTREQLTRLARGELSSPEIDTLERHILNCSDCSHQAETLDPGDDRITRAVAAEETEPHSALVDALMFRLETIGPALNDSTGPADGEEPLTDMLAPPQRADELGRLGPFRVLKVLGRGGMGVVFLAEDVGLQRPVAIKAMLPSLAANPRAKDRFLREARAAASVHHDHIVVIHAVAEHGIPFLAMELLEGESLDDRLQRDGRLPAAEVIRIGREIAEGLAAAHDSGLIHRDIKPSNLWLQAKQGRVKILDFGLARSHTDPAHLTRSGTIVGTPAYMAPEQADDQPVDHRCDLFSLGCVLYRMSTGQAPFKGRSTLAILSSLAVNVPTAPREIDPNIPAELSDLIMQLLAKNPSERPASARVVAGVFADIESGRQMDGPRIPLRRTNSPNSTPNSAITKANGSPRGWALAAGAVGFVAMVGVAAFFLRGGYSVVREKIDEPAKKVVKDGRGPGHDPATSFALTKDQQAFLDTLRLLPMEKQQNEVTRKLQQINGIYGPIYGDPKGTRLPEFTLEEDEPVAVKITDFRMSVLWPLLAFPKLRSIDLSDAAVTDLTPLTALPNLADLKIELAVYNPDADAVMKQIPSLRSINGQPPENYFRARAAARKEIDDMAARIDKFTPEAIADWLLAQMKKLNPKYKGKILLHNPHNYPNDGGYWKEGGETYLEFHWISAIT